MICLVSPPGPKICLETNICLSGGGYNDNCNHLFVPGGFASKVHLSWGCFAGRSVCCMELTGKICLSYGCFAGRSTCPWVFAGKTVCPGVEQEWV